MRKLQNIINCIFLTWLVCLTTAIFYDNSKEIIVKSPPHIDTIILKESIKFDTMQATVTNMLKVCDSLGIKYPRIVVSQAILESGPFKSNLYKKTNNPLGLYDSKNHKYFKFNHWTEAISAYQNMIEYKHKDGENYYEFLNRIGYAENKQYINKVKMIEKNIEDYELY